MTRTQAPRATVAPSLLSAVFVLVLGAWMHPVLAATAADARCDPLTDSPRMSLADDGKLSIQVVGHSTPAADTPDVGVIEDAMTESVPAESVLPAVPRADTMLRRIIDEAQLRQPTLPKPEQAGKLNAPLAVDKTEGVDETTTLPEADPEGAVQERPRFPTDDMLRYRQQMYRTDI